MEDIYVPSLLSGSRHTHNRLDSVCYPLVSDSAYGQIESQNKAHTLKMSQSHGGRAVSLWSHSQQSGKVSGIAPRDIRFGKSDPDSSDAEDHGSAGTEDDESEDIVSQSTVSRDTGSEGIVSDVTGSGDNGLGDVASESKDTGSKGIVSEVAGPGDVGPGDVGPGDVDTEDVVLEDIASESTNDIGLR
ncbi:hypothetical protein E4U28_005878 [Claviceps purpurea]|nr:hypothetical protein E4U28_005878 [Claviceps purpurea]